MEKENVILESWQKGILKFLRNMGKKQDISLRKVCL